MTYITETTAHGRTERKVDIRKMGADLARELGATPDADSMDSNWRYAFTLDGVPISMSARGYGVDATRVEIHAHGPDCYRRFLGGSTGNRHTFPEMKVSADRPISAIAKEVRRKLIDGSAEPMAALKADYDQWRQITDNVAAEALALKAAWPVIKTEPKTDKPTNRADWSVYGDGVSLGGSVNSQGHVTFDRLNVNADTARAILALILGAPKA